MKKNTPVFQIVLLLLVYNFSFAQLTEDCKMHPLFTAMPDHSIASCERKEFDRIIFYKAEKNGIRTEIEKGGERITVSYKYDKDWNNRPSDIQIQLNYINAVKKQNGEVLYQSAGYLYATFKKNESIYWVSVITDGSGYYSLTTIKEAKMQQDVVLTANEIKKQILEEGKAIFYNIYFDSDKAVVKPSSTEALVEISQFLKDNPSVKIFIVGHTDNSGTFDYNMILSKNRALAVVSELTLKYGIPKEQLEAQGVGPLAPVESNDSDQGKAKNRRVELVKKN